MRRVWKAPDFVEDSMLVLGGSDVALSVNESRHWRSDNTGERLPGAFVPEGSKIILPDGRWEPCIKDVSDERSPVQLYDEAPGHGDYLLGVWSGGVIVYVRDGDRWRSTTGEDLRKGAELETSKASWFTVTNGLPDCKPQGLDVTPVLYEAPPGADGELLVPLDPDGLPIISYNWDSAQKAWSSPCAAITLIQKGVELPCGVVVVSKRQNTGDPIKRLQAEIVENLKKELVTSGPVGGKISRISAARRALKALGFDEVAKQLLPLI